MSARARLGKGSGRLRRIVALRRWLLAGVAVLTLVLLGVFGWQAHRLHRAIERLPGRLGIDVRSQANGITYTQSVKGRVLFTVHASKEVQRQDGKTTLHDVSIAVMGKPGTNRTDSIRGDDFEYDQPNGVVKALGDVHIDLAAPDAKSNGRKPDATRVQVTTRGLILLQKLGIAATDEPVNFVYGDLHGSAHGADYDADTGTLRLRSDVLLDGVRNGKTIHVNAADAQLVRSTQQVTLHGAQVQSGEDRAAGNLLILSMSKDGDVQAVQGDGNVTIETASGDHLSSTHLNATLSDAGQPQLIAASGHVRIQDERYVATAGAARLHFNVAGQPLMADLSDAVQVNVASEKGGPGSELQTAHAVLHLLTVGKRTELHDMQADGGAVMHTVQQVTVQSAGNSRPGAVVERTTVLSASVLRASTAIANDARYISSIDGQGNTRVEQSDTLGNHSVSTADTLHAMLAPPIAQGHIAQQAASLQSVEQAGNVQIQQHQMPQTQAKAVVGSAAGGDSKATAQRAVWQAATGSLNLTGNPVVSGPGLQLAADQIALSQDASGTEAHGHVRGALQESRDGAEPVHVLAAECHLINGGNTAEFNGGPDPVRLWTTTAQLEAMHVSVDRDKNFLVADSGNAAHSGAEVRLFLAGQPNSMPKRKAQSHGATEVLGQQLTILGAKGDVPTRIETTGGVQLRTGGSDLRANALTATLTSSGTSKGASAASAPLLGGGSLATMTATGDVQLRQTGRLAKGERLLYTASNDEYELTGTPSVPSTLHDSARGDIAGLSLIFHGVGERVEVTHGNGRQVHTELPAQAVRPR